LRGRPVSETVELLAFWIVFIVAILRGYMVVAG
jgi:hypothetical protein